MSKLIKKATKDEIIIQYEDGTEVKIDRKAAREKTLNQGNRLKNLRAQRKEELGRGEKKKTFKPEIGEY
jgi:hypothetical protein